MLTVFPGLVQPVICKEQRQRLSGSSNRLIYVKRDVFQDLRVKSDIYLDQFAGAVEADLLRQLGRAQHLWSEVVDVSDGFGANSLERSKEQFDVVLQKRLFPQEAVIHSLYFMILFSPG